MPVREIPKNSVQSEAPVWLSRYDVVDNLTHRPRVGDTPYPSTTISAVIGEATRSLVT